MKPNSLHLVDGDEPTRQQKALAQIEASHRDWVGINGRPWEPFSEPRQKPTLNADDVLRRSTYRIDPSERVPLYRRLLRWLGRWRELFS